MFSRLFKTKSTESQLREDLTRLTFADFLEKHAGNTKDARTLMVVNMIGLLREGASAEEQDAMKKALVAVVGIEAADGWAYTIGVLGTILSENKDQDVRELIDDVLIRAERGFLASGSQENRQFLEMIRIARSGDFEGIMAYQLRNRA